MTNSIPRRLQTLPSVIQFPTCRARSTRVDSLGSVSDLRKFVDYRVLNTRRARATVTIPTIFRDFRHEPSNRVYHGGSPEYINPVEVGDTERKLIWPDTEHCSPDIIISIGAGYEFSSRRPLRRVNTLWPRSRSDDRVILDPVQSSSYAQDTWTHYKDAIPSKLKDNLRYVRLNAQVHCPLPRLDDVDEMKDFQRQIQKQLRGASLVHRARQIIASCFFFDIIQPPTERENEKLLCRGM